MTLKRDVALIAAGLILSAAAPAPASRSSFDRAAWRADFERVKAGLAQGYANLDWQIETRTFNLARADQQIGALLERANSDVEAVVVFYRLVDAFHDPHLLLLPGPPPASATLLPRQSFVDVPLKVAKACPEARPGGREGQTALPYARAPEWQSLSTSPFQAGLLGDVGVIRIPSFDEQSYPDVCQTVAKPELKDRDLQLAIRAELNRLLASRIADLKAHGMKRLVIDISGNGGGSEWSSEVAAMLANGKTQADRSAAGWACVRPHDAVAGKARLLNLRKARRDRGD